MLDEPLLAGYIDVLFFLIPALLILDWIGSDLSNQRAVFEDEPILAANPSAGDCRDFLKICFNNIKLVKSSPLVSFCP